MKHVVWIPAVVLAGVTLAAQATPPATQNPPAQAPATQPQQQQAQQPPLGPNQWRIDRSHSAASFSVRHNVVSTVRGLLGAITGTVEYDGKTVSSIKADVTVDVTRINTQNEGRDKHLRSDDFFNTELYPNMTFKSKRVEPAGDGKFKLIGDLTIRDKTKEVTLDVEGPSPFVKTQRGVVTGATATTKISRKEFGVLYSRMIEALPVVGDEITITIDMQLNRPAPPGTTAAAVIR